jgi:uncharacterized damage-inducible protein DinB
MTRERAYPLLQITEYWGDMHQQFLRLIDLVPDDRWDWSPKRELWNFRGILLHVPMARNNWLNGVVKDGETSPDLLREGQSREGMKQQHQLSWERLERFLSDPEKLASTYEGTHSYPYPEAYSHTGHWLAYHLLEHDVHHRADIFHYMQALGIDHGDAETP